MINFIKIPIENAQNMWFSSIKSRIDEGREWYKYQRISVKNNDFIIYRKENCIDVEYEVIKNGG
jgi:hypothetical protein